MKHKKSLALLASAAMTVSSVAPAFTSVAMAEGTAKYKDGTYSATANVKSEEDADDEFDYDISVNVTIDGGRIANVAVEKGKDRSDEPGDNDSYFNKAVNGTKKKASVPARIVDNQGTDGVDEVSTATYTSNAIKAAVNDALKQAEEANTPDTPTINKEDLQAAVEAVTAEGYEQSKYTAESWAVLQAALTTANEALANENATQEEVDAAKTNLDAAVAALVAPVAPAVDKTALNEAIENALTEQGNYTDESWQAYTEALNAAKTVQANENATQDAVDTAVKALNEAKNGLTEKQPDASESVYALMNIPYDEFYKAELNNNVKVDGVTSATKNKTRTANLVGGSYHVNADGTDITGVIYPVKIDSAALEKLTQITDDSKLDITVTNRGQTSTTTYEGKDALFGSASYSYYLLSGTEAPAAYKEVTVAEDGSLTFGEIKTEKVTVLSDASAELETSTNYGDYQINVDGLPEDELKNISAVILETEEGDSYGLRHLENIWRQTELAFSTGFTQTVHGCPVSGEHYKGIMGQTVNKITYVTQNGEYVINTNLYVPFKTGITATAEGKEGTNEAEVKFSEELPADFSPVYEANGIAITAEGNTLKYEDAKPGKYSVTVSDKNGKYADISAELTVMTKAEGDNFIQMDSAAGNLTSTDENVKVADYVKNITSVTVNGNPYAATGRGATKLFFDNGYLDITAAPFAGGSVAAQDANSTVFAAGAVYNITIQADGYPQMTLNYTVPDTIYAYANLTYGEYWAAEDVQAAGDTSSNEGKDSRGESDKGAFDAVSRATTNHGLHRGSFQQSAVIHTDAGMDFEISHWNDANTLVLVDGSTVGYNRGVITYTEGRTQKTATLTNYEVTGIKYVPVAVKADDFAAFLANRGANHVVVNGGAMAGGFGEMNLQSYTATANVTANTNGLKAVNKNADGSFSFAAAKTGTDSGLLGESQNIASNIEVTVKDANGSYGEFLRVDLTGDGYGALGDKMQTVEWTYYGSDSTYTTPVAHYGTKFAADNWMHKIMGIQLGLTESARCTLPAGTDGTGYWTLTVRALGYEDYTVQFQATEANIVKEQVNVKTDFTALQELAAKASEKKESDYTAESWKNFKDELDETNEMIEKGTATQAEIDEQIIHLQNAMGNLVTVPGNFDTSKDLVKQAGEKQEGDYTSESWAAFQAELGKLNTMIAAGTAPQSEINAQNAALENAMNALAKKSSSGSSHSSSSSSSSSSTTNNTTNTTTTNNTTVQAAPVSVGGTSPKTGDPTSLLGWMAAGLGSIGGLGALIRKRKK